jgi:hypothetical protein
MSGLEARVTKRTAAHGRAFPSEPVPLRNLAACYPKLKMGPACLFADRAQIPLL